MAKKVIKIGLSEREIDKAIRELELYKQDIARKTNLLREKVAERIADLSHRGFSGAIVDDLLRGGKKTAEVNVSLVSTTEKSVVMAIGEDAVWVEFGAGVYHNGSAGSSPHPSGAELGFTIGGYGKGMGERETWGFYEGSELRLTHGTPAVMPMYNAVKTVCDEIAEIAREVFK